MSKFEIPAGAVYTRILVSSHAHGLKARAKAERLQAAAPANVGYEVVLHEDLWKMPHQVYKIVIVSTPQPAVAPAADLDSLAKLASGLGLSPAELAAELAVAPAVVQSWINGTARPGEETRALLQRMVASKLAWGKGRIALHRIATLTALSVALQSATERKLWLAKQAETEALYR